LANRDREEIEAMNGLLGTILAGVVVAVIGAFAAYYFGVRQERLKHAYEKQREEQRRQEEEERELNKERSEVFDEIQPRALSVMQSFIDWCKSVEVLPTIKPTEADVKFYEAPERAWRSYFEHMQAVWEKANELENEIASLQGYYQSNESYLKPSTRTLFRSFDDEVVTEALGNTGWWHDIVGIDYELDVARITERLRMFEEMEQKREAFSRPLGFLRGSIDSKGLDAYLRNEVKEIEELVFDETRTRLQEWRWRETAQKYRTAFHTEKAQYND